MISFTKTQTTLTDEKELWISKIGKHKRSHYGGPMRIEQSYNAEDCAAMECLYVAYGGLVTSTESSPTLMSTSNSLSEGRAE